jgi:hypothetical protein
MNKWIRKIILVYLVCFSLSCNKNHSDQSEFNLGFEKITKNGCLPDGWFKGFGISGYKIISDSIEKHSGKYSILIEPEKYRTSGQVGICEHFIPAIYKGSEIELRGYIKYKDVDDGHVGLFLNTSGITQSSQIHEIEKKNLHGSSGWVRYSVKLPLTENVKQIAIGAINTSAGKLWVDELQILIDGKDISEAKLKGLSKFKGENDRRFDSGSGIKEITLSVFSTKNLMVLGKIWGFLKYYDPNVTSGDYNWDYELFSILPEIINCKNVSERNKILLEWVNNYGKGDNGQSESLNCFDTKLYPELDWLKDTMELGTRLSTKLIHVKNLKRNEYSYYVSLKPDVGNPQFDNENPYEYFAYPDAGFRLLSLFRYWNIIKYYYPYRNLITENWDSVLVAFIPQFLADNNALNYSLTTMKLITNIHDTHAKIYRDSNIENYWGKYQAPILTKIVEGKLVVTGIVKIKDSVKPEIDTGDIILSIQGRSPENLINDRLPLTSASNYPTQLREICADILRTNDTIIEVKYERQQNVKTAMIKCYPYNYNWFSGKFQKKDTCFKYVANNIVLIYPGNIKNEYLSKIMPQCKSSEGIIIDLRCYPLEFIAYSLCEYLSDSARDFAKVTEGSIENPGLFCFVPSLSTGPIFNSHNYKGKVIILINEMTQSQAEFTTMAFSTIPNSIVLGSTTAGADGDVSYFPLPGGRVTLISGVGIYHTNGDETQRIGIIPNIYVNQTIKGIQERRDELLDAAIKIIDKGKSSLK